MVSKGARIIARGKVYLEHRNGLLELELSKVPHRHDLVTSRSDEVPPAIDERERRHNTHVTLEHLAPDAVVSFLSLESLIQQGREWRTIW